MDELYHLRAFAPSDATAVTALIHRTIDACYTGAYPPRAVRFFKDYHSVDRVRDRGGAGAVLVIEHAGEIVATGSLVGGEITGVFVDPNHQRAGLGVRLMEALEDAALSAGIAVTDLSVSLPSRGFYERCGYHIVDARSIDVGEGERLDYWAAEKPLDALVSPPAPGATDGSPGGTTPNRATARALARQHVAQGDPLGWFEVLYAAVEGDADGIPWADLSPNPNLVSWLDRQGAPGTGSRALKIGCGLGDDAEELARRGFETTAFDISPTAIGWCRTRFPSSAVRYVEADLLQGPREWAHGFDLVVESYTLQVLPPQIRSEAMRRAADFVAPGGTLLVITRGRENAEDEGAMPWPLTRQELGVFTASGLTEVRFEDYVDGEQPPVRRFRVTYERPRTSRVGA